TTSRIDLTSSVSPNQQYTFSFTITAPMTPGTYNFQMQMVQELVTWFGDKTPNVQVTVNACPLSASSNPGTVPADGQTSSTITVQTPTNRANVPISLTTNLGSLSSSTCTTGTGGSCSVTITSTSGGTATITASSTGYLSATTTVAFTAITLSASPSSVPADSTTT